MTRAAVRIFLEQQNPDDTPLNYTFDVLLEGETIAPKMYYFGMRGFYRGEPRLPTLLSPDGSIDFGSDWIDNERWERTNLLRKRIRIGEVVRFWEGSDELPKSKDDEYFYVIKNVTDWGVPFSHLTIQNRSETRSAKEIGKRSQTAKPPSRQTVTARKEGAKTSARRS